MFAKKGRNIHVKSGQVFTLSMLAMSLSASVLAIKNVEYTNIIAALITSYLILTAWRAGQNRKKEIGVFDWSLMAYGTGIGVLGVYLSMILLDLRASQSRALDAFDYFLLFYTAMTFVGVLGDLWMIIAKGFKGKLRIVRHLWRMSFALWIASGSLFLGQPQVFPKIIQESNLLAVPVVLVILFWFFWLGKASISKRFSSL